MKRSLFLVAFACLVVSSAKAQEPTRVVPKQYKVAEVDITGEVSPDGRFLTYTDWSTGDLAVRDLKTGENRRLTNKGSWLESGEFAVSSTISPDGKRVAYAWFNQDGFYDLRVIGVDGSGPHVLYRNEEVWYTEPKDWSPDGKHILVTFARKDRTGQIVLVSVADGSMRVLKTLDWRSPLKMSFSPDGRYVVYDFRPEEDSLGRDIFLLSTHEGHVIPLVQHPANEVLLGWAPDGKRILFASDRTGTVDAWAVRVAHAKAQGPPQLVKPDIGPNVVGLGFTRSGSYYYGVKNWVGDVYIATLDRETDKLQVPTKPLSRVGYNTTPDWSPNGQYLAYISQRGVSPWDLYSLVLLIRSVETGKERELPPLKMTRFGGHAFLLHWFPDGHSLLAQGRDHKGREGFYRIDAQTGDVSPIVQAETCPDDCLEWPARPLDGKVIFTRWLADGRSIVVHNFETSQKKELLRAVSPVTIYLLAISPDGRRLAFVWGDQKKGATALKLMPTTGGEPRELFRVQKPEFIYAPAWTPDGQHILLGTGSTGQKQEFELWRISAEGGEPQNLGLAMEGLSLYGLSIHPDGRRIAFTAGRPRRNEVWVLENFLPALKAAK